MIQSIIQRSSYPAGKSQPGTAKERGKRLEAKRAAPSRASENFLPTAESLSELIRNALASLKEGHVWDRGSIINLNI